MSCIFLNSITGSTFDLSGAVPSAASLFAASVRAICRSRSLLRDGSLSGNLGIETGARGESPARARRAGGEGEREAGDLYTQSQKSGQLIERVEMMRLRILTCRFLD